MSILKQGEINAIVNNFTVVKVDGGRQEGRIGNNSIHLASSHEHRVSLRTNGLVVYGVYYNGDQKIRFTHDFMRYAKPYVKCDDYMELKDIILTAWKKTFDDKAKAKLEEVKAIVKGLLNKAYQAPEPVNTNTTNKIKKEEVKDMNKKVVTEKKTVEEIVELNIMQMAHKIRRELKLEGHYHVQMKIAMNLAWQVKKGESTIEIILNNNEVSAEATHTYNAEATAVETVEEVIEEPVQEEPVVAEPIVEEPTEVMEETVAQEKVEPVTSVNFRFYLHSLSKGQAVFYCKDMNSGHAAPCFKMAAKHIRTLDSDFANKYLSKLLHQAPNNTVIEYYGDFTYITFMNNDSLRQLAASKNITLTLGVAPSGDVA